MFFSSVLGRSYRNHHRSTNNCHPPKNRNRSMLLLLWMMMTFVFILFLTMSTMMNMVVVVSVLAWTPSRSSPFLIGSCSSSHMCIGTSSHMTTTTTSTLLGTNMKTYRTVVSSFATSTPKWTMYQEDRTPSSSSSSSSDPINAWTVLSTTERWISRTLAQASSSSSSSSTMSSSSSRNQNNNNNNNNNNPYVRKEISYYCEHPTTTSTTTTTTSSTQKDKNPNEITSSSLFLLMASIFRHLKEMRQIGEQHVQYEIERWKMDTTTTTTTSTMKNEDMVHTTLRQTHVIVIPSHTPLKQSFVYFDTLIQTINQMRRNARDFYHIRHHNRITNKSDDTTVPSSSAISSIPYEDYYSISINCAHLHPLFGQTTTTTTTTTTTNNDEEDPKYIEYQKQRQLARQSPYPTIVMEVRVTPTPLDLLLSSSSLLSIPPPTTTTTTTTNNPQRSASSQSDMGVSLSDIQKLEALFGQSAYIKEEEDNNNDNDDTAGEEDENYLWDHIMGNTIHEIVIPKPSPTPIQIAQEYIASITTTAATAMTTIPSPPPHISFTTTNTTHVDEAYEYVMTNIAMCLEEEHHHLDASSPYSSYYYYLVMPHFLPLAATSFEKFTREIQQCYTLIVSGLLSSSSTTTTMTPSMTFTTYHPEHIQSTHRSPLPILAIEYRHGTSSNNVE